MCALLREILAGSILMPAMDAIANPVSIPYLLLPLKATWVKVFRIIPEFRILRLTFHRKAASKC